MAAGIHTSQAINDATFSAAMFESLYQQLNAFNAVSRGSIVLNTNQLKGYYAKRAFYPLVSSIVTRRDLTSVSAATDLAIAQSEEVSVKIFRKYGPAAVTPGSIKTSGASEAELVAAIGRNYGEEKLKSWLNTGLIACEAALQDQAALTLDVTGESTKTLKSVYLAQALQKMGDQQGNIVAWVMHSKPFSDLIQAQITENVTDVASVVLYGGSPASFNRPIIVTDSSALTDANGSSTDTYNVLGLVAGGIQISESEPDTDFMGYVSGLEQLIWRVQREFSFSVGLKGLAWDTSNGGANPTDATLAVSGNWDQVASDDKGLPGVRIVCQ